MEPDDEHDDLWGPIEPSNWRDTPCIRGRCASEQDVEDGLAVFAVRRPDGGAGVPAELPLPACATIHDEDTDEEVAVVIVQAEIVDDDVCVGFRHLSGGNGVCLLNELELIDEPNALFYANRNKP